MIVRLMHVPTGTCIDVTLGPIDGHIVMIREKA